MVITMTAPPSDNSPNHGSIINYNPNYRAESLDEKAVALLTSPVGQAFITTAAAIGLTPSQLADPATSLYLAAQAADDVELYHTQSDREKELSFLHQGATKHSRLARQILAHPDTSWWFTPLDTGSQIWVSQDRNPPTEQPSEPSWIHADTSRSLWAFVTSTHINNTASMLAAVDLQICDVGYGYGTGYDGPPFAVWHMKPAPGMRIFEISSPHAWHELCVRYPLRKKFDLNDFARLALDAIDVGSYMEPDWAKVAEDWDAVHLTLGGLLTSHQVPVESQAGWTYHYGWDAEQTRWLRWAFTEHKRIDDHTPASQLKDLLESKSICNLSG